jgi:DUF2993 family protein
VAVVAVVAILLAADAAARAFAQSEVSGKLQSTLGLRERPRVSLGGFPFLARLIAGSVPTASLSAGPTTVQGIEFDDMELELRDVTFSTGALISGGKGDIHVAGGSGTATVKTASIPATVFGQRITIRIRFEDGVARVSSDQLPGAIRVRPSIDGGKLIVRSDSDALPLSVSYDLPEIVRGIHYTSVRVTGSVAILSFELREATLPCCD